MSDDTRPDRKEQVWQEYCRKQYEDSVKLCSDIRSLDLEAIEWHIESSDQAVAARNGEDSPVYEEQREATAAAREVLSLFGTTKSVLKEMLQRHGEMQRRHNANRLMSMFGLEPKQGHLNGGEDGAS